MTHHPPRTALAWPFACEHDDPAPCTSGPGFTVSVEEGGSPVAGRQTCDDHLLPTLDWALGYPVPYEGEAGDAYLTRVERRVVVARFAS